MTPETISMATEAIPTTIATGTIAMLGIVMLWEMIRKGIALWKTGNQKKIIRFICIFIFNTAGLLPIIYLTFFNKKKK